MLSSFNDPAAIDRAYELGAIACLRWTPTGGAVGALAKTLTQIVGDGHYLADIKALEEEKSSLRQANANLVEQARNLGARTQALLEATEQLNAFCQAVAHDLRAPLRTQDGLSEALIEDFSARLGPEGIHYVNLIREVGRRESKLIDDLLAYVSLGRGDMPLEPIDLAKAVAEACLDLQADIQGTRANIRADSVSGAVLANGAALYSVLTNLLSNALKFMTQGARPEVMIWTEMCTGKQDACFVRLWMKDSGIGIPASARSKIFGAFERLHPTDRYPGTGLGLAIVNRAMARMGGGVGVEPGETKGSCFWIELPATSQRADHTYERQNAQ